MADFPRTEQEERLEGLFAELGAGFKELDRGGSTAKQGALLQDLTNKLKDAKA